MTNKYKLLRLEPETSLKVKHYLFSNKPNTKKTKQLNSKDV